MVSLQPWDIVRTFSMGLFFDLFSVPYFCLPLISALLFIPVKKLNDKKGRYIVYGIVFIMDFFAIALAIFQFVFWNTFHSNFNFVISSYVYHLKNFSGVVFHSGQSVTLILVTVVLTAIISYILNKKMPRDFQQIHNYYIIGALAIILAGPFLGSFVFYDSLSIYSGDNRYNKDIATDGAYAILRGIFYSETDYTGYYTVQDGQLVSNTIHYLLRADNVSFVANRDVWHVVRNQNELTERRPNLIIIDMSDLCRGYVDANGRTISTTPFLDNLQQQSYDFKNMYCCGVGMARSIESITLSQPPLPVAGVLNRENYAHLHSLNAILRQNGYANEVFYGGYTTFDVIRPFFEKNDISITDRSTLLSEENRGRLMFGVPDEMLYKSLLASMDRRFAEGVPTFAMVLTTVNSKPYNFPGNHVQAVEGTREGTAMYADWALKEFFNKAAKQPWFANTIFVITTGTSDDQLDAKSLPVSCFKVPFMVYSPQLVAPQINTTLCSQIDVTPTLLGIMGISYGARFLGNDILRMEPESGRAFVRINQGLYYIKQNRLVLLTPDKQVQTFRIDDKDNDIYTFCPNDPQLMSEAISYYQEANVLYRNGLLQENN
jgi:phosphoglycerol transferase MdoB-like AlkP superfamily enzyme